METTYDDPSDGGGKTDKKTDEALRLDIFNDSVEPRETAAVSQTPKSTRLSMSIPSQDDHEVAHELNQVFSESESF